MIGMEQIVADILGTSGDDQLVGTAGDDVIDGGEGRDRINGGDGNDTAYGGAGNDYVYGDAGNDTLYGGEGNDAVVGDAGDDLIYGGDGNDGVFAGGSNDTVYGGNGNDTIFGDGGNDAIYGEADDDKLYGKSGNDRLDGGEGTDTLDGGSGNDTLVYRAGQGADVIAGNTGVDTLELHLTSAEVDSARGNIADFSAWLDGQIAAAGGQSGHAGQSSGEAFTFDSLGLSVSSIEAINIYVDGVQVPVEDFLNAPPVAAASQDFATDEDVAINGSVNASDPDGDPLSHVVTSGPANGTVAIDEVTGDFTYTPTDGFSGSDAFTVSVTDPDGASVEQVVNVDVAPVADAPEITVPQGGVTVTAGSNISGTSGNDVLTGTEGDDVINGGAGNDVINGDGPSSYDVALDIDVALGDTDGSESLAIEISGVPTDGSLSAGTDLGNGRWSLSASDLDNLTMTVHSTDDVTLTIDATATEATGEQASVSSDVSVTFEDGNGGGDDIIAGGLGNDRIDGGDGFDTVDYSGASSRIYVNLTRGISAGGDGNDTISNVEGVIGSDYNDIIGGTQGDNVIEAGAGSDGVWAFDGDDVIIDGAGDDYYDGGTGADTVDYSGVGSGVTVDLGLGRASGADSGNDRLRNIENAEGSGFADELTGTSGANALSGGDGNDVLRGGRGVDVLTGGSGADTFSFERGDVVSGRTHHGVDQITDFGAGDRLDFEDLLRNVRYQDISDVVQLNESADGTTVSVNLSGSAGWTDVVFLDGVFDLDLDFLDSNGLLVV